jgi:3D (Asp-Asp-Asp) domain-containing protein
MMHPLWSHNQKRTALYLLLILMIALIGWSACKPDYQQHQMQVTATAYNSHLSQTSGDPWVTAWGDTLDPRMKAIAVSRDLIDSGLTHGTQVEIEGLPGSYTVRDKMHWRWQRKIDIYMGTDVEKAREWGRQDVIIRWKIPASDSSQH